MLSRREVRKEPTINSHSASHVFAGVDTLCRPVCAGAGSSLCKSSSPDSFTARGSFSRIPCMPRISHCRNQPTRSQPLRSLRKRVQTRAAVSCGSEEEMLRAPSRKRFSFIPAPSITKRSWNSAPSTHPGHDGKPIAAVSKTPRNRTRRARGENQGPREPTKNLLAIQATRPADDWSPQRRHRATSEIVVHGRAIKVKGNWGQARGISEVLTGSKA